MTISRTYVRELQVTYKPARKPRNGVLLQQFQNPREVFDAFNFLTKYPKEVFVVVLLDNKNRVLGFETVSMGTETDTTVKPTCAFRAAIHIGSVNVIFLHNHPSGDPTPSPEDRDVYGRLQAVGQLLGIKVIDFIIIGDSYVSLKSR